MNLPKVSFPAATALVLGAAACWVDVGECAAASQPVVADTIFLSGSVWTGVRGAARAQAIAVAGGKIVRVGSDQEMAGLRGPATEVVPLGGTRWKLVSVNTPKPIPPYVSKVVEFRPDARVITTTTKPDGQIETFDESYRVVGDTLIVNKPGYLINAKFTMENNRLIVTGPELSAMLERLPA